MKKDVPSPAQIREFLDYDPETGILYWKPRASEHFVSDLASRKWNTRWPGREALTTDNGNGYRFGCVCYQHVYAHRVVWCWVHGSWPSEIDHVNRDRSDNRIDNLREVSHRQNCANQGMRVTNSSGVTNVGWDRSRNKWVACARINGRRTTVGRFDSIDDATAAAVARQKTANLELAGR